MSYKRVIEKMLNQEPVFMFNDLRNVVIRSVPGPTSKFMARTTGGKEYPLQYSTELASETLLEGVEITEKEYYEY